MIRNISVIIALTLLSLCYSIKADAAFCSLRDPVTAIQSLYNGNYQYRSVVATVTEQDRAAVKKQLPFTIHQNEVGKHTLYIVSENNKPIGFLQARSEWAKWGLVEIAWAINKDKSIKGFYFQRCRSPQCNDAVSRDINAVLKNKTFSELSLLLNHDGKALSTAGKKLFQKAPSIALLAVRSALKTLLVTDLSWEKQLSTLSIVK